MTVEELMEVLSRCDKHKPVSVSICGILCEIDDVKASSPFSVSNPVEIEADSEKLTFELDEQD